MRNTRIRNNEKTQELETTKKHKNRNKEKHKN